MATILKVLAVIGCALLPAACSHSGVDGGTTPATVATTAGAAPPGGARTMSGATDRAAPLVAAAPNGVFFDRRGYDGEVRKIAEGSRPSADRLRRVEIVDAAGFGQPMTAMTIEIPEGWSAHGGVDWNRSVECVGNTYPVHWSASSPDGLHGVALLPRLAWQVESGGIVPFNPCPAAPMDSARAYLEYLARNARPGMRVLAYRARPEYVALMQQTARSIGAANENTRYDAGELLIGYSLQGAEMREAMLATLTFSTMPGSVQASADTGLSLRAPDGLLDFALADRIFSTLRTDRQWGEKLIAWSRQWVQTVAQRQAASIQAWHARRMSEISTAGMLQRARIRQDTLTDIGRINDQIVASRDASGERMHEQFIDYIQEVQPWRDPSTGSQVDLSIHYKHAWQLDDGRQFLTNDANVDPARDFGINGHRLEPAR